MNNSRLHDLITRAVADGILPKDAMLEDSTRPWPIVLMTGLGAWLAAIPLFVLMFLIFKGALLEYAWCYALGLLLMAAALAVLRNPALPVLVEQWSLPGLLVGGALIAYGCYRDMSYALAGTMITALGLATAWLVPQNLVTCLTQRPRLRHVHPRSVGIPFLYRCASESEWRSFRTIGLAASAGIRRGQPR